MIATIGFLMFVGGGAIAAYGEIAGLLRSRR